MAKLAFCGNSDECIHVLTEVFHKDLEQMCVAFVCAQNSDVVVLPPSCPPTRPPAITVPTTPHPSSDASLPSAPLKGLCRREKRMQGQSDTADMLAIKS
uniref:BTB domain-containing protein n=1 Tax=Mesocestoides corti TaxID=53468 RepID=A0A5K3EZ68_MESCO